MTQLAPLTIPMIPRFLLSFAIGLISLLPLSAPAFTINGTLDSPNYLVADNGMRIWASVQGTKLYVATWSSQGGTSDHFLLIQKTFANPEPHPWAKSGNLNFYFAEWPWLAGEGDAGASPYSALNNGKASGRKAMGSAGNVLEAEIDLVEVFGSVPEVVYLTALAFGDNDGAGLSGQSPAAWFSDNDLQIPEMAAVRIDSIRDEDQDGYFDRGSPTFHSVAGTDVADANYGLRRYFLDEVAGESDSLTFRFTPGTNPAEMVTGVELITNLNRREKAVIEENRDLATPSSDTYYRAYPMSLSGGIYSTSVPIHRCGVYRATVRYYVDGAGPFYFTDKGQRRDLAIVVSPKKALDTALYEVNPFTVEATAATQAGRSTFRDLWMANTDRPDIVNLDHFRNLGVNMLWVQPVHPIGLESRGTDPATSQPYQPGSPYAVKDYWKINPLLGAANTDTSALAEFQTAVAQFDAAGIGLMMDGTFNHSAPDVVLGQGAVDLFPWATSANSEIRSERPQWFSKANNYLLPASSAAEIALAPDRTNFSKWSDVRDFYFGNYDSLVKYASSSHQLEYLLERDSLEPLSAETIDLWEYFAYYPIYWLEKTGHSAATPAAQADLGIDGLRCDFAQGLPSPFWEYCINKTRSRKWNFLFMAESLDGYTEVAGNKRHGVSYRSARQFDVLNENIVFHWRDTHFAYPASGIGTGGTPNRSPGATVNAYNNRRQAYEGVVLLNSLTSHDEVLPSDLTYELLYAYAQLGALDGVPMIFYGQEAGLQNNVSFYGFHGVANASHNFAHYEVNFGKSIPHFKKWNAMTAVWQNRDWTLQALYGRINQARQLSPALRSRSNYYLSRTGNAGMDPAIFAVAKFEQAGLPVSAQDVVFCFVNTDYVANSSRTATFDLSPITGGANWFGIEATKSYHLVDLLSSTPTATIWPTPRLGSDLISNGLPVTVSGAASSMGQAHYYRLIDTSAPPDTDDDGLPDAWETANGLNPLSPSDALNDADTDGAHNLAEYQAGTDPQSSSSRLTITHSTRTAESMEITWSSVSGKSYRILVADELIQWQPLTSGTTPLIIQATSPSTSQSLSMQELRKYLKVEVVVP